MRYTDEELIAQIEAEEAIALPVASQLAAERSEALDMYRGVNLWPAPEGRSNVTSRDVADTVEWIMPSLNRIFLGGDEIGRFEPLGPQDEQAAEVETEAINWYLTTKSDYFSQINATLRDALLLKNGYIVTLWKTSAEVVTETYQGQSDEEMAMLMHDPEVQVVEHSEYPDPAFQMPPMMPGMPMPPPPMLHDVKVERKKAEEYPAIESVPPDEMLVSPAQRWTSLLDADFVQWRRRMTVGQARAEGFDIPDDIPAYSTYSQEWNARDRYQTEDIEDGTTDPTRKYITLKDTYVKMDLRGDGKQRLWRIVFVDGASKLERKEEADIIPFAAFTGIVYSHSHVGTSIYDLISDLAVIKTTLQRQQLDNIYLQNSGRMAVDVSRVNLDDLLLNRPGGIVRIEGEPGTALFPIVTPDVGAQIIGGIEYCDAVKEGRTGVTRYSAGLDANTLNKTATGVTAIQSAANQRIELIARTLASGFRDLFLVAHALSCKHSTKAIQMKLNGKWTPIDPRSWAKRTDFQITVGLGTGTPEQQMMKLQALMPVQQQATQLGLATPLELYNFGKELYKAAGYKNADKFLKPPQPSGQGPDGKPVYQMPPPPDDPMVQTAKVKSQADMQKAQMDAQSRAQEAQFKHQADLQKFGAEQEVQKSNDARQAQLDQQRFAFDAAQAERQHQLEVLKMEREFEFKVWEAKFKAQTDAALEQTRMQTAESGKSDFKGLERLVQEMHQAHTSPREVVRDANGRVVGVKTGNRVQQVQRDEQGRVTGLH